MTPGAASPAGAAPSRPVVDGVGMVRRFGRGSDVVRAVDGVDLRVERGELAVLYGRSGSGKTTLLNALGGLERLDAGSLSVCGVDLVAATDEESARLRRERLAFVFQNFGLIDVLTAAENVALPLRSRSLGRGERDERVARELDRVGLSDRSDHLPSALSGGEQQRVAVARALAVGADLLLVDEPTAQLDPATGARVIEALRSAVDETGATAVVSTHDPGLVAVADLTVGLSAGAVVA